MRADKLGFLFGVLGCIASSFAVLRPWALTVSGGLYIASNIGWIIHAKRQGETYLGLQHKVYIAASLLMMASGMLPTLLPDLFK